MLLDIDTKCYTASPSLDPTSNPTDEPSRVPTDAPSSSPSASPSQSPTRYPIHYSEFQYGLIASFGISGWTLSEMSYVENDIQLFASTLTSFIHEGFDDDEYLEFRDIILNISTINNHTVQSLVYGDASVTATILRWSLFEGMAVKYLIHYHDSIDGQYIVNGQSHGLDRTNLAIFVTEQLNLHFSTIYTTDSALAFTIESMVLLSTAQDLDSMPFNIATVNSTVMLIVIFCGVLFAAGSFSVIAFLVVHRQRSGTDYPNYLAPFKFGFNVADLYTDVIWTLVLVFEHSGYATYALLFTFGSYAVSIIVGVFYVIKWKATRGTKVHLSGYGDKYGAVVIFSCVIAGFYATAELITSNLFHLGIFSLHITRAERQHIRTLRILNVIILENLPLFVVQLLYLSSNSDNEKNIDLTLITIGFSSISILSGISNIITILCSRLISKHALDDLSTETLFIEFSLKQKEPGSIKSYHIHSHCLIQRAIASALCLGDYQVVIHKIQKMSNGIMILAKLKLLSEERCNVLKAELRLEDCELRVTLKTECIKQLDFEQPGNVTLDDFNLIIAESMSANQKLDTHSARPVAETSADSQNIQMTSRID